MISAECEIVGYQVVYETASGDARCTHPMTSRADAENYKNFLVNQPEQIKIAFVKPVSEEEKEDHRHYHIW